MRCCEVELQWKNCSVSWDDYPVEGTHCPKCGTIYERKKGDSQIYVKRKGDRNYRCKDCGSVIEAAEVGHPIHDSPIPLAGSGKCEYEKVPFCPNCEEKPSSHGSPISKEPQAF